MLCTGARTCRFVVCGDRILLEQLSTTVRRENQVVFARTAIVHSSSPFVKHHCEEQNGGRRGVHENT